MVTLTPIKNSVCVFRTNDIETDCATCARIKVTEIPKGRQSWQYVPKIADGEKCPSYFEVTKPVQHFDNYDPLDDGK